MLGVSLGVITPAPVSQAHAQTDDRLMIVTTTTQIYDATRIVAGDEITVIPLMGAGVDPHLYKPTEEDIERMSEADALFYSGLHLEGQFDEVFEALGERDILTYAVSEPVDREGFVLEVYDNQGNPTGTPDPHFWFDPRNWQLSVMGIAEVLSELDPDNEDIYTENAELYNEQLDLLYEWAFEAMSTVPETQRVLITSHDAFEYFGGAFGWQVRGLQGISTQDEAGVADIQNLVQFIKDNQIPVLFVESSVPPDAILAVQEAVEAEGAVVGVGVRELYSDAMGEPDTFGGTYVGMLATNVVTILQSYGYEVPEFPEGLEPIIPDELLEIPVIE
jgi:manganese/zinc/iron transport system substrate-binding protein